MQNWFGENFRALQNPESNIPAIALIWVSLGAALAFLVWPRGRTWARQLFALAALGFREGLRLKVLWTVLLLSLIPGTIAYFSDADGTHAGRAKLILDTCIASGELLGAALIVLLSALSVAREIESRIMHSIGAKPVPRWTILTGKALGFWAIDLCFLVILLGYCALLVRAVPLRAETHALSSLEETGSWTELERNALTTRLYVNSSTASPATTDYAFIRPGMTREWLFSAPAENTSTNHRSLRFVISSNNTMFPFVPDVRITAFAPGQVPFLDRKVTVPVGKPFEFYLDPKATPPGEIRVTITAPPHPPQSQTPPVSLIVPRSNGVRLGIAGDGFAGNLVKAFILMAIQGWMLAIITASWSGVLSFPVTVALGLVLVLGGELSRYVIELVDRDPTRTTALDQIDVLKGKIVSTKPLFEFDHLTAAHTAITDALNSLPAVVEDGSNGDAVFEILYAQINTLRAPDKSTSAHMEKRLRFADDLQANVTKAQEAVAQNATNSATRFRVKLFLKTMPDFRAAGGPSAFVEGHYLPLLALAHTALWMGLIRGIGWALPGFVAFQRREIGA